MTINSTVYVFGNLGSGYTQHPDDYTKEIFKNFAAKAAADSQIIIHRNGNLMYYGYIRKLDSNGRFIGFCILLNGAMLRAVGKLFRVFEDAVSDMTVRGTVIGFDERGAIVPKAGGLDSKPGEADRVAASISRDIAGLSGDMAKLPPVHYAVSNSESKSFSIKDSGDDEIAKASTIFSYTFVYKDKGYNTDALNGYKGVITRLHKEKDVLSRQYDELKKDYNRLNHQKKQYRKMIILCVVVIVMGVGGYFLYSALTHTERVLADANATISHKNDTIGTLSSRNDTLIVNINDLHSKLSAEKAKRKDAEDALANFSETIKSRQPFFIKGTSFNFSSGMLYVNYHGLGEQEVHVTVRAFSENYYNTRFITIDVEEGDSSFSIYIDDGLDSQKYYNFAVFIGNTLVGGGRH